jgi:hypothetical protein
MISPMRTDPPTIWLGRTDTMRDDDRYISGIGVHSIRGLVNDGDGQIERALTLDFEASRVFYIHSGCGVFSKL